MTVWLQAIEHETTPENGGYVEAGKTLRFVPWRRQYWIER